MKTIGIIGGLTWLSTLEYYRILNELVNEKLGGVSSARIVMHSVNFEEIKTLTVAGDWEGISRRMQTIAQQLESAGADCLMLGANTMHKIARDVQSAISIPLIHIADAVTRKIAADGLCKVALMGTKYTMQLDFYKSVLAASGIETIVPDAHVDYINDAIYEEMGKGQFLPATKKRFINIIEELSAEGAKGIILGCTEIPILVKQADVEVPVYDTTRIHAAAAVAFVLGDV